MASILLESRPYRPFKSSEEYLEAMKEDLAEWLNTMYPELLINSDNFMDRLDTGVALCKHANHVRQAAEDYLARRQARNKSMTRSMTSGLAGPILAMGNVHYLPAAKSGTFFARDNVSNFITWCRKSLKIFECLLFETDDLIMRKNEKHVILCLLEVARRGAKFGMLAPMLVQMERQIDREIAADNKANGIGCGTQTDINGIGRTNVTTETELFDTDTEDEDDNDPMLVYGPQPQIITNDLKSLDEMVRDLVEKCTCPSQFPMVRVSEGKYRIGDTKVLIFVRILRSHVMVRVGGGWDTLSHYLDKHDPCRCKSQHRSSVAARLIPRSNNQANGIELHKAQVIFERSPPSTRKMLTNAVTSTPISAANNSNLTPLSVQSKNRSRSPTPQRKYLNQLNNSSENNAANEKLQPMSSPSLARRSMSPSPRRLIDIRRKQTSLDSAKSVQSEENANATTGNRVQFDTLNLVSSSEAANKFDIVITPNGSSSVTPDQGSSSKFENISDNGSEISDEGYRSLGVIQQSNAQKRESIHSQLSMEDAENNVHPDPTSSDSQLTPSSDEQATSQKTTDTLETTNSNSIDLLDNSGTSVTTPSMEPNSLPQPIDEPTDESLDNKFEQSGVFITDDEITVDIAGATGLRKTGFSSKIYGDESEPTPSRNMKSKIPRSPIPIRRRSVDGSSCGRGSDSDLSCRSGLPAFNRKIPVYRSARKPSEMGENANSPKKTLGRHVTNTWNGRVPSTGKKRGSLTGETFSQPVSGNFERNSKTRSSQLLYDNNGRRVKGTASLTTSPVKNHSAYQSSPLAQQLLEAANNAKNDAQILEKMKVLLSKYSTSPGGKTPGSNPSNRYNPKKPVYDDFTTAWVQSNGTLERASSCSPPTKAPSKRSSAASSCESTNSRDLSVIVSPRRDRRGPSKIPGPVRQNTELY